VLCHFSSIKRHSIILIPETFRHQVIAHFDSSVTRTFTKLFVAHRIQQSTNAQSLFGAVVCPDFT
jgi:hypothetical protein